MASPKNRNPRAVWEEQNRIDRDQVSFAGGMNTDDVITLLGDNQVAYSANWILRDMFSEVRTGTEILSSTELPSLYTGITATKSGYTITVTGGHTVAAADVGKYFVWDNGADEDEYITAADTVAGTYTVNSSTARSAATAATMRAEPNALIWHKGQKKYILMIGQKLYYAPWNVTAWTEIYSLSPNDLPTDAKSKISVRGNNAYLWNSNGIYMIRLGDTIPVYKKVNITMGTRTIQDSGQETDDTQYCRRYITTMSEMSGSTLLNRINGNTLVHETAPSALDEDNRDYVEKWTTRPTGLADKAYGILTGGYLGASYDEPSDWESLINAQANFTANGETYNIACDFSGCQTFYEVALRIQTALRDKWPSAIFEFKQNATGKYFVFTMPNEGDYINYCTAGSAGTDISGTSTTYLEMLTGQSTITSPTYTEMGTFSVGGTWEEITRVVPTTVEFAGTQDGRAGAGMVSLGGNLYLCGGTADSGCFATVGVYKSTDDGVSWTNIGSMPVAKTLFGIVVYDNKIWVIGGYDQNFAAANNVYYSSDGVSWTQATAAGAFTAGFCRALVYDSKMWVFSGGNNAANKVHYSTDGITWTQANANASYGQREEYEVVAHAGLMWVVGGMMYSGDTLKNDLYYSSNGVTWTQKTAAAAWGVRKGFAIISKYNIMYVVGGGTNSVPLKDVWYSYDGETWKEDHVGLTARFYPAYCEHDGHFYYGLGSNTANASYINYDALTTFKALDTFTSASYYGLLPVPTKTSGANYYARDEFTHYTLWATEDAGPLGIKKTGDGNDEELYIWLEDVPIIKSFVISAAATGIITASKGTFSIYDVGSALVATDGTEGIITEYYGSTSVKWSRIDVLSSVGATIGTDYSFTATQAAYTVTIALPAAGRFASTDVGKRIFWSDGTMSIITGYTSATVVTVADSTTRTAMGGGILYSPGTTAYDNYRNFNDTITDKVLRSHLSSYWLRNRFWVPLPDSDTGCFWGDFMVAASRNSRKIYYNELLDDYMVGYYSSYWQKNDIDDAITELRDYKSVFSVICTHSTYSYYPDRKIQKEIPSLGELVSVLAYKETRSNSIGCVDWGSIVSVEDGVDIFKTSDGEVRMFDGITFGNNLVGKNMKAMRKMQPLGTASFDAIRGYVLWGTQSVLTNSRVPFPDVCWSFAVTKDQGVGGGIYITGDDWIKPPDGIAGMQIVDSSNHSRQVALDNKNGKLYWLSTYEGPSGSGLGISFVDKDDGMGTGTEISATLKYRGHIGASEFVFITHDESHFFFSPYDISKASTTGYDSNGYRSGTEINVKLYKDYAPSTEYDYSNNIPKTGDVSFSDEQECHVHQFEIISNRSEVSLRSSKHIYWQDARSNEPSLRTMTEDDYQEDLCQPVLWPSVVSGSLINRVNNAALTPGDYQLALGPTGDMDALSFRTELDFGVVNITNGTVIFWEYEDSVAVRIGVNDGTWLTPVSAGSYASAYGTWYLMYALNVTDHGALIFSPTGGPSIWNPQVFNSAISTAALAWLLADMTSGRQIMVPMR